MGWAVLGRFGISGESSISYFSFLIYQLNVPTIAGLKFKEYFGGTSRHGWTWALTLDPGSWHQWALGAAGHQQALGVQHGSGHL